MAKVKHLYRYQIIITSVDHSNCDYKWPHTQSLVQVEPTMDGSTTASSLVYFCFSIKTTIMIIKLYGDHPHDDDDEDSWSRYARGFTTN